MQRSAGSRSEPYPATHTIDASLLEQLLGEHLNGSAQVVQPSAGQGSNQLCQFFVKAGWCKFGEGCRYRHEGIARDPPNSEQTAELCLFFQKAGWCKHGDQCKHIHALQTAATGHMGPDGADASDLPAPGAGYGKAPSSGKGSFQWGDGSKGAGKGYGKDFGKGVGKDFGKGGGKGGGQVCDFFAKAGWCKWGDACRFAHNGGGTPGGAPPQPQRRFEDFAPRPPREPRNGEVAAPCKYYTAPGGCKHGEACPFIHEGQPGESQVCQFFVKTGWCKWNDQCKYLHIGPAEGVEPRPPRDPTGEPCQFFAKAGWCKYGEQCRHVHIEGVGPRPPREPLPPGSVNEPCQFFSKSGWCKFGDNCKYMHTAGGGGMGLPRGELDNFGSTLIEGL